MGPDFPLLTWKKGVGRCDLSMRRAGKVEQNAKSGQAGAQDDQNEQNRGKSSIFMEIH